MRQENDCDCFIDDNGNHLIARIQAIRDCMLVDVKCGKSQRNLVLQLRGKPLLYHHHDHYTGDDDY